MNIATIKAAIYSWAFANGGGLSVVWSDQASPRPTRPYIDLRLNGPFRVAGQDEMRLSNTNGVPDIVGHRRLILAVQVRGDSVMQKAEDLNFSLGRPSVQALFRLSNISITNEGNLTNLSQYIETKFEEIFAFDVELLAVASGSDNTGYINKTEITGLGETTIIEG